MKAVIINGGPRKYGNTMKLLERAKAGAESVGADVSLYHLYDIEFGGCRCCLACKRRGNTCNGLCAVNDALRPILEDCINADSIIIGSPAYCFFPTGVLRCFTERLIFPTVNYLDYGKPKRKRTVNIGAIYTMHAESDAQCRRFGQDPQLRANTASMKSLGHVEELFCYGTPTFSDPDKYDVPDDYRTHYSEIMDTKMTDYLERAFCMGRRLGEP